MTTTNVAQPSTKVATPERAFSGVTVNEKEALACLRILTCIAKANGKIEPDERAALESSVSHLKLPSGTTMNKLLDETIDLDAQLRLITTPETREIVYQSAMGMAHLDRSVQPAVQKMLEHIRSTLHISDEKSKLTRRILDEAKDTVLISNIKSIDDPALRATEVKSDVVKYSVLAGVLGSFPIPGVAIATDLAVVALQVKMVRDIGQRWGHQFDKPAAVSMMGGLGLGTGARIAASNLAKFVPVWGSAVGATTSFASTWALGKVAEKYFESGLKSDAGTLKSEFQTAQSAGQEAYAGHKEQIETKRTQHEAAFKTLNAELAAGKINQNEYSSRIEQFA